MQTARIRRSEADGQVELAVEGNLSFDVHREFRESYKQLPATSRIIIDLSRADYVDSAGLGMLIQLREHCGGDEASVTLQGANETIRTILDVANFSRLFRIV